MKEIRKVRCKASKLSSFLLFQCALVEVLDKGRHCLDKVKQNTY